MMKQKLTDNHNHKYRYFGANIQSCQAVNFRQAHGRITTIKSHTDNDVMYAYIFKKLKVLANFQRFKNV